MESKIFVLYLGIAGIRSEDIEDYKNRVASKIVPNVENSQCIVIPTQSYETKMVCINPVYVTEEKLIEEHTALMRELNELLAAEIKNLNDSNGQKD